MKIPGRWREGYALDVHTLRSQFLGYDEFGHEQFDNKRSEIGELLYRAKYKSDKSVVADIAETVAKYLRSWKPPVDVMIPVPPSNVHRRWQVVIEVATAVASSTGISLDRKAVVKCKKTPELKSVHDYDERLRLLEDAYTARTSRVAGKGVLLFDDLYRSGATLSALTEVLLDADVTDVYALALTRTRSMM